MLSMGKSTISMAIFHSYVSLPTSRWLKTHRFISDPRIGAGGSSCGFFVAPEIAFAGETINIQIYV